MADTQEFLDDSLHSIYETGFNDGRGKKVFLGSPSSVTEVRQAILQHFQQEQEIDENTSDGYHTFKELYDHRIALFIALMRSNPLISWRANNHEDGTGFEGWFIAGMHLPTGDITYHLPESDWTKLDYSGIATSNKAPKWDGHSANDVVERLNKWFKEPVIKHEKLYTQSEVDRLIREATTRELEDLLEHEEPSPPGFRPCIRVDRVKERLWEIEELSKQKEASREA